MHEIHIWEPDHVEVEFRPGINWDHSSFPHPLITVDYDAEDNFIAVTAMGSRAPLLLNEYQKLLHEGSYPDPKVLIPAIADIYHKTDTKEDHNAQAEESAEEPAGSPAAQAHEVEDGTARSTNGADGPQA